jgi:hypothetical protein
MLAESYACLGQPEASLTALTEAQALMATTHEALYGAEIARLQGELHLQVGGQVPDRGPETSPTAAAERCLQHALAVARRQQAKSWELRVVCQDKRALGRFW